MKTNFQILSESSKKQPLISIVIATYNVESTIQRCLDSVIKQTYFYKELIVMDGGSTDGSVDIIKQNETSITYWESQTDQGIHHAWNKALEYAKGDWIYFLGADDYLWKTNTLEQVANYLEDVPEKILVVYGKVAKLQSNYELLEVTGKPWNKFRRRFLQGLTIDHQGVFHHKKLFDVCGKFKENYLISGDYELLLRYLKNNKAIFVDEIIAGRSITGISSNTENSLTIISERLRARKEMGINTISLPLVIWYSKAKLKLLVTLLFGVKTTQNLVNIYRVLTGKKAITR